MKRLGLWGAIISLMLLVSCKKNTESVDVCIYGGTSAGVIAAYTASMEGKTVLLVEPGRHRVDLVIPISAINSWLRGWPGISIVG